MPTELRIIDRNGPEWDALPDDYWRRPEFWGLMWRMPDDDVDGIESWFIVLPDGAGGWQTTDRASLRKEGGIWQGERWTVTGTAPKITVNPSIDSSPEWHGWIKDGICTP